MKVYYYSREKAQLDLFVNDRCIIVVVVTYFHNASLIYQHLYICCF